MGILPIVFEKSGLNEIKENIVEKKETNKIITSKCKPLLNEEKEKDTQKEKKEGINKKSLLIRGVTKHKVNGNFEFSMDKEDEDHNISGNEENYFNQNSLDDDK